MPSSRPTVIVPVLNWLRRLQPTSILDVGVGFGKWGHLFREYTDIVASQDNPARYRRENWQVRIDGVEGHQDYLSELHQFLYRKVHVGRAEEVLEQVEDYDVIFFGDIIEHFDKAVGKQVLVTALAKAKCAVIVTTPKFDTHQEDANDNPLEVHRSLWTAKDFRELGFCAIRTVDLDTLIALWVAPGVSKAQFSRRREMARWGARAVKLLKGRARELASRTSS